MCFPLCLIGCALNVASAAARPFVAMAYAKGAEVVAVLLTSAILAGPLAAATSSANTATVTAAKTGISVAATTDSAQTMVEKAVVRVPIAKRAVPRVSRIIVPCTRDATSFRCSNAPISVANETAATVLRAIATRLPV